MSLSHEWSEARVRDTRDVAPSVRLIEIEPAGGALPYAPGSHINVSVLIDGRPDVRSYSLIGEPGGVYRIAVKRMPESRGGSLYMWSLTPGARLSVTHPNNLFELSFGKPEYLLMAGGIGITPIYGHALALARANAHFRLLYGSRTRDDMPFVEELRERIGDRLEIFLDEKDQRIDMEAETARLAHGGEVYLCGPIGMLEAARRAWQAAGRPLDGFRFETFGNSGRYAPEPFTVRVPRLGIDVVVPENKSMLDALQEAGVDMMYDCLRGECGLCAVDILEADGTVDHRDVFFSDRQKMENAKICTCVSRVVKGGVTIDPAERGGP